MGYAFRTVDIETRLESPATTQCAKALSSPDLVVRR